MKYTEFFNKHNKANGVPVLNSDQFGRYMNIVHLEARIKEMNKYISRDNYSTIFKVEKQLTGLTGNLKPEDLLKEMVKLSF